MSLRSSETAALGTRDRILSAAALAFCANGFNGATVKEIADGAGVNEVTVFRYFPQKHDLYWPAIDWYFRASGLAETFRVALCQNGPPRELLLRFAEDLHRMLSRDPGLLRLFYFTTLELDTQKRALFEVHVKPLWDALITRIKLWIHEGALPGVDPEILALTLTGGLLPKWQLYTLSDEHLDDSTQSALCAHLIDFLILQAGVAATATKSAGSQ